ncbi:MAG: nitrile hydratase subunit beta [Alphaproteobacteria bacterium]|nr:nitrile hydratase subunit beta [Alphaproteobacteria bacterium]
MNGIHDMGGVHGYGPIDREEDEPVFHHAWEGKALALARVGLAGGHFNLDEFRHAMERIAPVQYLSISYYERWLEGTLMMLDAKGVVSAEEFQTRLGELSKSSGGGA